MSSRTSAGGGFGKGAEVQPLNSGNARTPQGSAQACAACETRQTVCKSEKLTRINPTPLFRLEGSRISRHHVAMPNQHSVEAFGPPTSARGLKSCFCTALVHDLRPALFDCRFFIDE
jgi:hypothetical protein